MRIGSRRNLLKTMGALAGLQVVSQMPSLTWAAEKIAGQPMTDDERNKQYMADFHQWYCQTHFDFNKAMTPQERDFVKACLSGQTRWWKNMGETVALSTMTYSHRVNGKSVNSSRLGYGSFEKNDQVQKLGREICKHRGIDLAKLGDKGQPLGLGWDFEADLFKVYFFEEDMKKQTDPAMKSLVSNAKNYELHPFGLRSYSYKAGKLSEHRAYVPLKDVSKLGDVAKDKNVLKFKDQISHVNLLLSDKRGVVPQYDLNAAVDAKLFNEQGQKLLAQYSAKFKNHVDTLAYDSKDEFVLYYP